MKKLLAFIFAFVLGIPLPLAYADNMRSNVAIPIPIPITLLDASTLQVQHLQLNYAQICALNTTPRPIILALGPGTLALVIHAAAYANGQGSLSGGSDIAITYGSTGAVACSPLSVAVLQNAHPNLTWTQGNSNTFRASSIINQPVQISTTQAFSGGDTDETLDVWVWYRLLQCY